jgi:hypothetical protein
VEGGRAVGMRITFEWEDGDALPVDLERLRPVVVHQAGEGAVGEELAGGGPTPAAARSADW